MKRIAILFSEFQNAGLPCALQPNGRTERDFDRWSAFIEARDEVSIIAYEFTTGTSRKARIGFHLDKLAQLASRASRPLDIVVRGKSAVIPELRKSFRNVTYIESVSFMKAMKRQRAQRFGNEGLDWVPTPTAYATPLDELLMHNIHEHQLVLRAKYFANPISTQEAA